MDYPINCITNMQRYQYTCKAQEELKNLHNFFSKWLNTGITLAEYDKISAKITADFPYKAKLAKEDYDKFYGDWRRRLSNVLDELCTQRAKTEDDYAALNIWTVDPGDLDARKPL